MRPILAILLLLAAPVFAQDLVARQGNDSVRLTATPCESAEVLAIIDKKEAAYKDDFRRALAQFQGQTFEACWHPFGGGAHLIYADGDEGQIPMDALKPALDI